MQPWDGTYCYLLLRDGGKIQFLVTWTSYYDGETHQTYYNFSFTAEAIIDIGAGGSHAFVRSIGAQYARLDVVREHRPENLGEDALLERRRLDREREVYTPDEIARHPVAGGEVDSLRAACMEVPDPRVLEEPIDDRSNADPFAHSRNAGPQAADAAHQQVDVHSRLRGAV